MRIALDPATMFFGLMASTFAAVLLLLWTYHLNRHERSLLWVAVAFALACIGVLSMAGRQYLPMWVYFQVGVTCLISGISMIWAATRSFNGKPIRLWMLLLAPVAWIAATLIPGFIDDFAARMIVSSLIIGTSYLVGAYQLLAVRDGLKTRLIAAAVIAFQAAFVLVRIPFVILDSETGTASFADTSWFSISALQSAIFVQVLSFLMISLTKERVEQKLRDAALTDALTGVGNRRAYFDWTSAALARGARSRSPVATVLFDLDRFKEINDRFGHPVGDAVIQAFANVARNRLRAGDFVARLGGEEFAVTLPDTTGEQAATIAREINAAFAAHVGKAMPPGVHGTASAGVADTMRSKLSVEELLTAADRALYEAKALGRGEVRLAPEAQAMRDAAA